MPLDNSLEVGVTGVKRGFNNNVNGLIGPDQWASQYLTYSFPSSASDYTADENYRDPRVLDFSTTGWPGFGEGTIDTPNFTPLPTPYSPGWNSYPFTFFLPLYDAEKQEARRAFNLVQSYTNLTLKEITDESSDVHAVLRLANSDGVANVGAVGQARAPGTADAGDIFFAPIVLPAAMGNNASLAIFHEIGHALGLTVGDHVFDRFGDMEPASPNGTVDAAHDNFQFSVMNNPSFIGGTAATEQDGSSPQSYMMGDIAALQQMYGANFSNVGQSVTYGWNWRSGEEFINGMGQGQPAQNKIFETVWTGGADSTFDLCGFFNPVTSLTLGPPSFQVLLDMRPGHFMRFSEGQLAEVAPGKFADGNVYNALVFTDAAGVRHVESEIHTVSSASSQAFSFAITAGGRIF